MGFADRPGQEERRFAAHVRGLSAAQCEDPPDTHFRCRALTRSFDAMSGANWFTTLDLASGLPPDRDVGGRPREDGLHHTYGGLYEFNRMPVRGSVTVPRPSRG